MVNNAGATLHLGDLADTPVDVIRRVVDLNLTAAIFVARQAVRHLRDGGALVNVSSGAATLGSPHEYVHYAAAKAGVDALTHGLAQEVAGRGIRVNGVAPGIIRTDIHAARRGPGPARAGGSRECRWAGWVSPRRWPRRSPGCSRTPAPTPPAPPCGSPAAAERRSAQSAKPGSESSSTWRNGTVASSWLSTPTPPAKVRWISMYAGGRFSRSIAV